MPSEQSIKSFWNQAADEHPYWYVSSYGPYDGARNLEEFWASGRAIWMISSVRRGTPRGEETRWSRSGASGAIARVVLPTPASNPSPGYNSYCPVAATMLLPIQGRMMNVRRNIIQPSLA